MKAKDKAKELVEKYYPLVTTWDCYNDGPREDQDIIIDAKQCALIAVDEIIKSEPTYTSSIFQGSFLKSDNTEYWQEVKEEIEKL